MKSTSYNYYPKINPTSQALRILLDTGLQVFFNLNVYFMELCSEYDINLRYITVVARAILYKNPPNCP